MRAAVEIAAGVAIVDLEDEEVVELDATGTVEPPDVSTGLPLVVAADQSGPLIVAVVARRPPLVVSRDAGSTWHEIGSGLPTGRGVAISPEHPDVILFAGESRLFLSRDGGRFWHGLGVELDDIRAVEWLEETGLG
ncbi:MAG: hypothetical protein E6G14_05375 [Actinobacteria bacterium]|nr:MAG: hypothetical protein E6G14_05375 [Actinomycetota bacterium]